MAESGDPPGSRRARASPTAQRTAQLSALPARSRGGVSSPSHLPSLQLPSAQAVSGPKRSPFTKFADKADSS
ncbi:Hypothetical predicted protein [Marmota monax]|uniref:Uncharacterized protein n=1 Tax=Marmota monax TaxID=9995 RepID=A0A5E4A2B4_MARMO|nr:hypothetical protein GHT09_015536 [Marmota monax]VTJ51357.1 Hypothetical predicted protein [Marmota monax]